MEVLSYLTLFQSYDGVGPISRNSNYPQKGTQICHSPSENQSEYLNNE